MSLRSRLNQIEAMIANIEDQDPNDPRLRILEAEANELNDQLQLVIELSEAQQREQELRRQEEDARIMADVIELKATNQWDLMITRYGAQFVEQYEIQGNTVLSYAKEEVQTWTVDDPQKKLRRLLTYRIYDHYVR